MMQDLVLHLTSFFVMSDLLQRIALVCTTPDLSPGALHQMSLFFSLLIGTPPQSSPPFFSLCSPPPLSFHSGCCSHRSHTVAPPFLSCQAPSRRTQATLLASVSPAACTLHHIQPLDGTHPRNVAIIIHSLIVPPSALLTGPSRSNRPLLPP